MLIFVLICLLGLTLGKTEPVFPCYNCQSDGPYFPQCLHNQMSCHGVCVFRFSQGNPLSIHCEHACPHVQHQHQPHHQTQEHTHMPDCEYAPEPWNCGHCCHNGDCVNTYLAKVTATVLPTMTRTNTTTTAPPPQTSATSTKTTTLTPQSSASNSATTTTPPSTSTGTPTGTATAPALTITTTTTAAIKNASCVQCGDLGNQVPCNSVELLQDSATPCSDPTASYCMTDVVVDATSMTFTYKRCVDHGTCFNDWYLQTSDKHACLTFDPTATPPNIVCHYCCAGDACNVGTVPDASVQWRPS